MGDLESSFFYIIGKSMKINYFIFVLFLFIVACTGKKEIKSLDRDPLAKTQNDTSKKVVQSEKKVNKKDHIKYDVSKKLNYKKFTKGIYLTAYTINTAKSIALLDSAEAAGMNTLIFDLRNMNGHVFFEMPQKGFLRGENIKPTVDIG